jgi:hypothetical protein
MKSCGPVEERNATIPIQKTTVNKAKSVIQITCFHPASPFWTNLHLEFTI